MNLRTVLIAVCLLSVSAAPAVAQTNPAGPVTNGNFEHPFTPDPVVDPVRGTPLDECYGVGHQVLFGSESTQSDATGADTYTDFVPPTSGNPDDVDAWLNDRVEGLTSVPDNLQTRADAFADDPEGEAEEEKQFQAGPDNCVWGKDTGYDVAYVTPVKRMQQPLHWSLDPNNPGVEFDFNFDDDPFDREAKFPANSSVSNFNMWQWAGSPHQAWTANVDAFEFDIENGATIHDGALFELILTTSPQSTQPDASQLQDTAYNDCGLEFNGDQLRAATGPDSHVVALPLNAEFGAHNDTRCGDLAEAWSQADSEDAKRDVLRQVRINQLNFRGWNLGNEPIVIDNVALTGASTVVEGAVGR